MKITHLHIENFRSIRSLDLRLDDTTVFIGPNNAGKSAILEAVRIALSRRWGQQGTGFTSDDVHCSDEDTDPRTAPPVKIGITLEEPHAGAWPADMRADLDDIMSLMPSGLNRVAFSVIYSWNADTKSFEPGWQFFNSAGQVLAIRRRSVNLSALYNYLLFFWIGALRDADDEFAVRSRHWGGLLRSIQIPDDLEAEVKETLDALDAKLLAADPRLSTISETIGRATEIAIGSTPGAAKLRMLPLNIWDLLARAGIILRNEGLRPWLPLDHHGQGLQSLSIIFLLQAAIAQRLSEEAEGAEPVLAIEEPEVHLHPQAARTLWARILELTGQKLVTTHSPYFVQNVPLHNLRIVRFHDGSTTVDSLQSRFVSDLPWTQEVENLVGGRYLTYFTKDQSSGCIAATVWFEEPIAADLATCWRGSAEHVLMRSRVEAFRHTCRVLVSENEERELAILGRRVRGEIFFARAWILVEGPSEHLLLHAIGQAYSFDLDQHGVSVIDFQNSGNAAIYPALGDAFGIPWQMATDGDEESNKFLGQLLKRGYCLDDLKDRVSTLTPPNDLEHQLVADGHEDLLREILTEMGVVAAGKCSSKELLALLKNRKIAYMTRLALRVSTSLDLAARMPRPFVAIVEALKARCR